MPVVAITESRYGAIYIRVSCSVSPSVLRDNLAVNASGFLGSVTVSTPFLKLASILSASTPSGTAKQRSKEQSCVRAGISSLFFLLLALDRQSAVGELHFDVSPVHAGKLSRDLEDVNGGLRHQPSVALRLPDLRSTLLQ